MNRRRVVKLTAVVGVILLGAWALSRGLEQLMRPSVPPPTVDARGDGKADAAVRHIQGTLFYASPDGQHLTAVQREIPFGEGNVEQGRQIVQALLTLPPPDGLVSAVPPGTTLRGFYVSELGDGFVDLGPEIIAVHPGGSVAELFTVYAIVNAVTANLPAVKRVQILIGGREVDTLAGHVDLRRPLPRSYAYVRDAPAR